MIDESEQKLKKQKKNISFYRTKLKIKTLSQQVMTLLVREILPILFFFFQTVFNAPRCRPMFSSLRFDYNVIGDHIELRINIFHSD